MKELIERIKSCNLCKAAQYKNLVVKTEEKPCLEVYEKWIPEEVKCLSIGESPPGGDAFFYPHQKDALRRGVFSLLGINENGYEGLCEFKRRGLLLVDVLKCRVEKRGKIPKGVIKNCLGILKHEIELLAKSRNVRKLVVLGRTALEALKMLGFGKLERLSVTRDCGRVVKSQGFEVLLCALPLPRNKKYWNTPQVRETLKSFLEHDNLTQTYQI
jgi:uracil-DNA glycosylase